MPSDVSKILTRLCPWAPRLPAALAAWLITPLVGLKTRASPSAAVLSFPPLSTSPANDSLTAIKQMEQLRYFYLNERTRELSIEQEFNPNKTLLGATGLFENRLHVCKNHIEQQRLSFRAVQELPQVGEVRFSLNEGIALAISTNVSEGEHTMRLIDLRGDKVKALSMAHVLPKPK